MSFTDTPLRELELLLLRTRNADGGWAYHAGKASRLEPTSWALLALGRDAADPSALQRWPVADGLLLEGPGGSPNYGFHGVALLAMRALGIEHAQGTAALLAGIQKVKGTKLRPSTLFRQDNSLQGWSWIADTFSWAEPTAWCLLALKQWKGAPHAAIDPARIDIAERLLVDRCCATGGWNYGNANALGQQLKAFIPTTAIGLLALQDRRSVPEVVRSIEFLEREATTERSGTALSLALMALAAFGRPAASAVRDALAAQVPTTIAFGNQMAAALALYALKFEKGHAAVVL